jgi:hypothetical protein
MSTLTDIRQTYTVKRQRTALVSEKEFSEGTLEDLLTSPSLVKADTERLKLFENNDENLFKDMGKRDALVRRNSK